MELYLIKDQTLVFKYVDKELDGLVRMSDAFPGTFEPIPPEHEYSKEYCKLIRKETRMRDFELSLNDDQQLLEAKLAIPISTSDDGMMSIDSVFEYYQFFGALDYLFERKNLSFHLTLKELDIKYSCGCIARVDMEAKDWELVMDPDFTTRLYFWDIKFPEHGLHPEATTDREHASKCRVTLTVKAKKEALAKVTLEWEPAEIAMDNCKRLLDEAIGSDLVIVAGNGAEVKAHKNILMVSSDAFRAMFENQMRESTTNRLEMPDMSEDGVQAFLKFIYTHDQEAAKKNCDIALELFQAGDKYGMRIMKKTMKTLICSKQAKWFNVDMAVRLSLLVLNLENNEEILKKTADVLKWYSKNSFGKLVASEEYVELSQKQPQLAVKLFGNFMKSD